MYSIGQVEELTGVKSHVLRYWETVIPGFAPQKDAGGHRIYTQKELETVMRLNYLINEKKFTIEGARAQIVQDAEGFEENAGVMMEIHQLRKELISLFDFVKNADCFK